MIYIIICKFTLNYSKYIYIIDEYQKHYHNKIFNIFKVYIELS